MKPKHLADDIFQCNLSDFAQPSFLRSQSITPNSWRHRQSLRHRIDWINVGLWAAALVGGAAVLMGVVVVIEWAVRG